MKPVEEWKVYVITDRNLSKGRTNEEVVRLAISGGADVIQLRDKEASTKVLYQEALRLRSVTKTMDTPFIINDRIDIALAVDADGVHLGQDDLPVSVARGMLGPKKIIGISTHSLEQARIAFLERPDYVGIGPIYTTKTKETGPPLGVDIIRRMKERITIPVIAIGGITLENIHEIARTGANCAAFISAVVNAEDVEATVRRLKEQIETFSPEMGQEM